MVVKFIKKTKVLQECWEEAPEDLDINPLPTDASAEFSGRIPREVLLLRSLDHPNIIRLVGVFQGPSYYQLVMEHVGKTFDLFEFIDENGPVDEALASHIFRQVVSAVAYLHSQGILHRDIKDENIVLDTTFHATLIDFGSACFMGKDKLFDTFCGTLEYCAPEVLEGNPYRGPELEMFSMGATLYTVIYGASNPTSVAVHACRRKKEGAVCWERRWGGPLGGARAKTRLCSLA